MELHFDHLFWAVIGGPNALPARGHGGFNLDFGREHVGQGTANRLLLWRDHYVEFFCLNDAKEARSNALRMDRRFAAIELGANPWGICFRGEAPMQPGWQEYQLWGTEKKLDIWSQSLVREDLPLIIRWKSTKPSEEGPHAWGYPVRFFEHSNHATSVARIEMLLGDQASLPPVIFDATEPAIAHSTHPCVYLRGVEAQFSVTVAGIQLRAFPSECSST